MAFSPLPPTQAPREEEEEEDITVRRSKVRQLIDDDEEGGGSNKQQSGDSNEMDESEEEEEEGGAEDNEELVDFKKQLFEMEAEESGRATIAASITDRECIVNVFQEVKTEKKRRRMTATVMKTTKPMRNCSNLSRPARSKSMTTKPTAWPKYICECSRCSCHDSNARFDT